MSRAAAIVGIVQSLLTNTVWATCTQQFEYRSASTSLSIMENFGSDRPLSELLAEAETALPMLHGWEGEQSSGASRHSFHFACGQHNHASHWRDDHKVFERRCDPEGVSGTLALMLKQLGWSGRQRPDLAGYTIQLAYLPAARGLQAEWQRWDDHIFSRNGEGSPEAIAVRGDCVQQSLWLNHYGSGDVSLRFGIFHHYRDALKAIQLHELPSNHAQILPHRFQLNRLRNYIQH